MNPTYLLTLGATQGQEMRLLYSVGSPTSVGNPYVFRIPILSNNSLQKFDY